MKVWLNLWRHPRGSPPYEATVHTSEEDAVETVADDAEDQAGAYACTVLIDPASLEPARRLDLSDAAHELVEDRRIEREAGVAEGRMLGWRQAGT
ncbi:hypothetical protein [Elioraea sp.]|uniref:hypothetical protein n=1 Tax=Elioraea sp. TaxID=2185103 RepID=UPI003F6E6EDB